MSNKNTKGNTPTQPPDSERYKIRPLLKEDQERISGLFVKLAEKLNDESLYDIISGAREAVGKGDGDGDGATDESARRTQIVSVFMSLFRKVATHFMGEVNAFFASLINVTPTEYAKLPFDIDIRILRQLQEAPEVENFFTGALLLYNATGWFGKVRKTLQAKLNSAIALMTDDSKPLSSKSSISGGK